MVLHTKLVTILLFELQSQGNNLAAETASLLRFSIANYIIDTTTNHFTPAAHDVWGNYT